MNPVDLALLEGRPQRVVMLPTAAGEESPERIAYWSKLGVDHYRDLGVASLVLPVLDRDDANSPELAHSIEGAGLIYLSGGSPAYLAETLRNSVVLAAIIEAWHQGAALAGCSAGACALTAIAGGFRHPERLSGPGLGLIDHLAIIPHFDRFDRRDPALVAAMRDRVPSELTLIGVDERTAIVGGPEEFLVMGEQSAWWIEQNGNRQGFAPGTRLRLSPGAEPFVLA